MNCENYMHLDTLVKKIPCKESEHAAGMDIASLLDVMIEPGTVKVVKTGIRVAIPAGYELQIRPRSGMSVMYPNYISNAPGTIDADYRGDISVAIVNNTYETMSIKAGDRIAQLVYKEVPKEPKWNMVATISELPSSIRGTGGFGSTGRGATIV